MNDTLQHYGVLGMKWGVRRGKTDKAYAKAEKKMRKLDKKSVEAYHKATKHKYSLFGSLEGYMERLEDADKRTYKAAKWYESVSKVLGEEKASQMNLGYVAAGKKYANWIERNRAKDVAQLPVSQMKAVADYQVAAEVYDL